MGKEALPLAQWCLSSVGSEGLSDRLWMPLGSGRGQGSAHSSGACSVPSILGPRGMGQREALCVVGYKTGRHPESSARSLAAP